MKVMILFFYIFAFILGIVTGVILKDMPQTKKGKKIKAAMQKTYGKEKGKSVYYASIVKGKVTGAEGKGGTGKLAKAKRTYAKKHKSKSSKYESTRKKVFGLK